MNPIAHEPVLTAVVAAVVAWAAARYGFKITPDQSTEIAAVVLALVSPYARQLVRPVAKDDEEPTSTAVPPSG